MDPEPISKTLASCSRYVSCFLRRVQEALRKGAAGIFAPAIVVGNPERARKKGELDGDDERLRDLDRAWREMLANDPWTIRLRKHVRLLQQAMFAIFLSFVVAGATLEARHPIFNFITLCFFATVPYWFWVGMWNKRINDKVFAEFTKRFGKHFHLE